MEVRDYAESSLHFLVQSLVLISDGNSEIGAHVRSNLCSLVCLRHLLDREQSKIGNYSSEKTFFPTYARKMF